MNLHINHVMINPFMSLSGELYEILSPGDNSHTARRWPANYNPSQPGGVCDGEAFIQKVEGQSLWIELTHCSSKCCCVCSFQEKKKPRTFAQTKPLPTRGARVQQHREVISNLLLEVRNIYCIFKGASVCQLYAAVFTVVPTVTQSRCETVDQLVQHIHTHTHTAAQKSHRCIFICCISVSQALVYQHFSKKLLWKQKSSVRAQIIAAIMVNTTTTITQRLWKLERKKAKAYSQTAQTTIFYFSVISQTSKTAIVRLLSQLIARCFFLWAGWGCCVLCRHFEINLLSVIMRPCAFLCHPDLELNLTPLFPVSETMHV